MIAPIAVLVCRVDNTRCPVREACTAISPVSRSRISPTMTTSGSCRRTARRPRAKVISTFGLTWVWPTPGSMYSIGSSMVRILREVSLICDKPAYSVVVFPEPVGPVTRIIPCGLCRNFLNEDSTCSFIASCDNCNCPAAVSSRRSTTLSPCAEGMVDIRISIACPAIFTDILPSCGTRFSAISSLAITFRRDTSSGASIRLGDNTSANTPSMR